MRKRFFIIDAMALAYRSFFALGRPLTRSDGFPTGALFGSAMFINKLITEESPDYLVVVTDTKEPTFRHQLYKDYKATRSKMPDDLSKQLPLFKDLYKAYGLDVVSKSGFEADDIIGTMASKFAGDEVDVYIVSGDKDFYQLVNEHVYLYSPKRNEQAVIVDRDAVEEKFHCKPEQVIDVLALMGDSSDNVPGVKGIGEKGAAKLISSYGTLEGIYDHLDEISGKKQKNGLEQHKDDAFLSRKLVTIDTNVPVELDLSDYECKPDQAAANEGLLEFYDKFEFKQLANKVRSQLGKQTTTAQTTPASAKKKLTFEDLDYLIVEDKAVIDRFAKSITAATEFCVTPKFETSDTIVGELASFAVCIPDDAVYYLDKKLYVAFLQFKNALANSSKTLVGYDLKPMIQCLKNSEILVAAKLVDVKVCDYLLRPNDNKRDLDYLCPRFTGELREADEDELKVEDEAINQLLRDSELIHRLAAVFVSDIEASDQLRVLREVEMPLVPVLAMMERTGVYIDADFLITYSSELEKVARELEAKIYHEADEEFNIASPKQLQKILYDKLKIHENLGVKRLKKTKTGFSTDESVLSKLSAHPVPRMILEYRGVTKLKSTYVDALPQHIHPKTGRLHTRFQQTVAATGRLSSDNPNLQNIPMRTELGRRIRRAFLPQNQDNVIISADYSQVELRLLAQLAGAEEMIEAFREGLDVHTVTAAKIFGVEPDKVDSELRSRAKAVNFGIIYGMGPQRLSQETGVTLSEAKDFIEKYFQVYPRIREYTQELIKSARSLGYTTTMTGRRRPIPGIGDSNRAVVARAENIAVNSPIQGSAADLIKLAMIEIDKTFAKEQLETKMLLQIHDELVFSSPKTEVEKATVIIKNCMESALETKVPLKVDIRNGKDWLEAH